MFSRTSGRSIFGLRIEPRSPPVHVTTCTSTPSATYLAVDAAPLLDSSSGCACTCISLRPARGAAAGDGGTGQSCHAEGVASTDTLAQRYGVASPWRRPALVVAAVVLGLAALAWLVWSVWLHSTPRVTSQL